MGAGFVTGVVSVVDHTGARVDTPNAEGDHSPIQLKLGPTMTASTSTVGALTQVTIDSSGGGGGGTSVALDTHADFRALSPGSVVDGEIFTFKNPPGMFVYSTSSGAGQADDDSTILKLTGVSGGSNGRAYNVNSSPVLPTIAALRLAVSGVQPSVLVQSYDTPEDSGGGIFDDVTATATNPDDGGVYIHAGSRIFKRRFAGSMHSEWFGVKANGSNEQTKFAAAIAASLSLGKALILSGDTIGITTSMQLSTNTRLFSSGKRKTKIKMLTAITEATTGAETADAFRLNGVSDIILDGLLIEAPTSAGVTYRDHCGVFMEDCSRINVTNCTFNYWSTAIRGWGTFIDSLVTECFFGNPVVAGSGGSVDSGVSQSFTADSGTDFLTATAHGYVNGCSVIVGSFGTLPAPLTPGTNYYVVNRTANTFQVAATRGGSPINLTTNGSGAMLVTDGYLHHNVTVDVTGPPLPTQYDHVRGITFANCQWEQDGVLDAAQNQSRGLNIGTSTQGVIIDGCSWDGWKHNALIFAGGAPITGFYTNRGHTIVGCTWNNLPGGTARAVYFFHGCEDMLMDGFTINNCPGDGIEIINSRKIKICNGFINKCGYNHDDTNVAVQDYDSGILVVRPVKLGGIRIASSVAQVEDGITIENVDFTDMANYGVVFNGFASNLKMRNVYFERIGMPEVAGDDIVGIGVWGIGQTSTLVQRYNTWQGITTFQTGGEGVSICGDFSNSEGLDWKIHNASQRHRPSLRVYIADDFSSHIRLTFGQIHGLKTGDRIDVASVHANANGNRQVTVLNGNQVSLDGTTPMGTTVNTGVATPYFTITGCTGGVGAITITTSTVHGKQIGDWIYVSGVGGNTNANGHFKCGVVGSNTIALNDKDGNAINGNGVSYTSGGRVSEETDGVVFGQIVTVAGSQVLQAPDVLNLNNIVVQDNPGIPASTRRAIRFLGTMLDCRVTNCAGTAVRTAAAGTPFDFGSNTVFEEGNSYTNAFQPAFAQYNALVMGANGRATYGPINLAQSGAVTGTLAASHIDTNFAGLTVTCATLKVTSGATLGGSGAPSQVLDVVAGNARVVSGSFMRPDNGGVMASLTNDLFTMLADSQVFKNSSGASTLFSFDATNATWKVPNFNIDKSTNLQLVHVPQSTDVPVNGITFKPQFAWASATGSNRAGGAFRIFLPEATNSGTVHGYFELTSGDGVTSYFKVQKQAGGSPGTTVGGVSSGVVLSNSGLLSGGPVPLDGGSGYVSGRLPVNNLALGSANQILNTDNAGTSVAWFTPGGDVTLSTGSFTVAKINGATVPAAGALTTAHVLKVSGASALTYGFVLNANVDSAAAIASTKLDFSAVAQDFVSTGRGSFAYTGANYSLYAGGSSNLYAQILADKAGVGAVSIATAAADNTFVYFDALYSAGSFVARSTSASAWYKAGAKMTLYGNTGLSVGVAFGVTARANWDLSNGFHRLGSGSTAAEMLDVEGRIKMQNSSAPSTPTGGPIMYAESGAAKVIGTSGTITTFGPAEPHCKTCGRDFALEWESKRYGHLAVCVPCLLEEVEHLGGDANRYSIHRTLKKAA
jgi:hypothetical protein